MVTNTSTLKMEEASSSKMFVTISNFAQCQCLENQDLKLCVFSLSPHMYMQQHINVCSVIITQFLAFTQYDTTQVSSILKVFRLFR